MRCFTFKRMCVTCWKKVPMFTTLFWNPKTQKIELYMYKDFLGLGNITTGSLF